MQFDEIFHELQSLYPAAKRSEEVDAGETWIEVPARELERVAQTLRDAPQFAFDMLNCISGVDYLHTDPKLAAKATWQPHLEVVYHLTSTIHRHRLVLKVILPRWENDTPGELPEVPSVAHLWATADWHEREVFDLMGVRFVGHPHLVRILCPEDWVGYPLRKDYEMPLEYHGIRGR